MACGADPAALHSDWPDPASAGLAGVGATEHMHESFQSNESTLCCTIPSLPGSNFSLFPQNRKTRAGSAHAPSRSL
jgi:hypothetical protein